MYDFGAFFRSAIGLEDKCNQTAVCIGLLYVNSRCDTFIYVKKITQFIFKYIYYCCQDIDYVLDENFILRL
jgi:hypothetical protein